MSHPTNEPEKYVPQESQQDDPRFISIMNELIILKDTRVISYLNWLRNHADSPRKLFRISGATIILLSVSVPLLSIINDPARNIILPVVTLVIAALTSLNSFFQWQNAWQSRRQTQFSLEYFLSNWELAMLRAKYETDTAKAIDLAIAATENLLNRTREISGAETAQFFENIQLPQSQ